MSNANPLLQDFTFPPFSTIKNTDFKPAFEAAIAEAQTEIDTIINTPETPDFNNTIVALDFAGRRLNHVASIFFNLNSAETNDEIQTVAQEVSPWLAKFQNDLILNEALFARVKTVYENREKLTLSAEESTLLEKHYKAFTRNGANLTNDKKEKLREIDAKLAQLSLQFGQNVLADTNAYSLHITNENEIDGLPESSKSTAADLAKAQGKEGYIFTLQVPSYLPFMKYVHNRKLRKTLALAYSARGFQDNTYNNEKIVLEIVNLRYQRAQLLGFKSHADFVLQERMAQTPEKVEAFLNDLLTKAKPAAQKEFDELEAFAKDLDKIDQLQSWDKAYYAEKLKQKRFDLDEEKLKPYFPLHQVIDGAFTVAGKLYGLQFKEVFDVDKYHEEVQTYRVTDTKGNAVALFYTDFHPRAGKRNGAWMTTYREQDIKDGVNERPQASIVCNFSRSTATEPALLTFQEVTTLFHEFGHSLHAMLANTTYPSLSGTQVFWDFVELPSQLMENWCYEKETIALFAKHYKTGEVIPMDLVEKIKKAANFEEGIQTVRQLSFGILDMAWHNVDPSKITSIKSYETEAFKSTQLFPAVKSSCMSTAFSHIFQGGYSAGYYSYKWAEVLDADAFAYFKENGIFDKTTANKFRENVLSKGGTEDPMTLYKRFRGQEPDPKHLLKRAGLIA